MLFSFQFCRMVDVRLVHCARRTVDYARPSIHPRMGFVVWRERVTRSLRDLSSDDYFLFSSYISDSSSGMFVACILFAWPKELPDFFCWRQSQIIRSKETRPRVTCLSTFQTEIDARKSVRLLLIGIRCKNSLGRLSCYWGERSPWPMALR